mgnify:CR=1 FL=1
MENKLRIYLVDDHVMLRQGVRTVIEAQADMEVIGEAEDEAQALQAITELRPDLVIMDIRLRSGSGIQVTEKITHDFPQIKVLILTQFEDLLYLQQALKAGAGGYLLKFSAAETIVLAIRSLAAGGTFLDSHVTTKMLSSFTEHKTIPEFLAEAELSPREEEVLRLLALGKSNREIAEQLHIALPSVETYRHRARTKLNLHKRTDIIRYAIRRGWLLN